MPHSYSRTQYEAKGEEVGLLFISPVVPDFVTTRTAWQCKRCGAIYNKSYRALCLRPNGCICSKALADNAYDDLAKDFGIAWTPGEWLPTNTKTLTTWTLKDGSELRASYSDLKWRLTNDLKLRLGLPIKRQRRRPEVAHA